MKNRIYIAAAASVAAAAVGVGVYLGDQACARGAARRAVGDARSNTASAATTTRSSRRDLSFEGAARERRTPTRGVWEAAIRKLQIGMMPPRDEPQPDPRLRDAVRRRARGTLDAAAAAQPVRRRARRCIGSTAPNTRTRCAICSASKRTSSELLPSDGGDFGFDNIAEVLTTSPLLLERYLTVALRVADMAVGDPDAVADGDVVHDRRSRSRRTSTSKACRSARAAAPSSRHTFPADGEYVFSGRLLRDVAEGYVGVEGHDTRTSS